MGELTEAQGKELIEVATKKCAEWRAEQAAEKDRDRRRTRRG